MGWSECCRLGGLSGGGASRVDSVFQGVMRLVSTIEWSGVEINSRDTEQDVINSSNPGST